MNFTNSSPLTQFFAVLGIFGVTAFVTYTAISTSGDVFRSTPYQTRSSTAETTLNRLTGGSGAVILDGIVAKIRAKAVEKGGNPFSVAAYNAYIDSRLTTMDALDNQIRSELGSDYAFIFQYTYPRVFELRQSEDKVASVLERFGNAMNAEDTATSQTSPSVVTTSATTLGGDVCKKEFKFGNLQICDTGKQSIYKEINSACPAGFHVPNYWEMEAIVASGVKLDLTGNYYFIASLYSATHNDPSYPFYNNPYVFNGGTSLNHTSTMPYGISSTEKGGVLCINSGVVPSTNVNGARSCTLDARDYSVGLSGKYDITGAKRKFLFTGEELPFDSLGTEVTKGNIDYRLNINCDSSGKINKAEKIAKVNSCKYGYVLKDGDCTVDATVCNLENLGNVHPTNSKVCSWKSVGTEKVMSTVSSSTDLSAYIDLNQSIIDNSFYREELMNIKNSFTSAEKVVLEKYKSNYNNKIDVKLSCSSKIADTTNYSKKFYEDCSVDGLFWQ